MKFSMIGTGNIAWFLSQKFIKAGHQCTHVFGRDLAKAKLLADTVDSDPTDRIKDIKDQDDVVIIAIADNAIAEVAAKLTPGNAVLVHTAGSVSLDVLEDATNRGVIWPIYSFVKNSQPTHRNIPTAFEVNNPSSKGIIRNLVHAFTDVSFEADMSKRQWLHLGAVIGNNFVNHLMAIDEMICKEQNVDFALLLPILQQTMERLHDSKPLELQTGPAMRGDDSTINRHLELLDKHPYWKDIYASVSASITETYRPQQKEKTIID